MHKISRFNKDNLSIYFVADPHSCGGRDISEVVMSAIDGGVTMVQLRNKIDPKSIIAAQAAMLAELIKPSGVPFLINDHVDIARDVEADGAHIGQGDMNADEARRILGEDKILGLTAFTQEHIRAVDPSIVNYIGTGPFFPTRTDKGKPVLGAEKFSELIKAQAFSDYEVLDKRGRRIIRINFNGASLTELWN